MEMDSTLKTSIWQQFGAAIDTLEDAINLCPDALWTTVIWDDTEDPRYGQFWFVAYHAVFWIDLYLHGYYESFKPPAPFIRGKLPEKPYSKDEVLSYLKTCRQKCQNILEGLTDEQAHQVYTFEWMELNFLELQLYSMRHVQEHAAQLNLVLGQKGVTGQDWIPIARNKVS
jgi:hypothetical protein